MITITMTYPDAATAGFDLAKLSGRGKIDNYNTTAVNFVESNILDQLKLATPAAASQPNEEWLSVVNYPWWYSFGYTFRPQSILEFGVMYGQSLFSIISGSQNAGALVQRVIGVDNESYYLNSNAIATEIIRSCYSGSLSLISSNISDAKIDGKFDLVSLDCHNPMELLQGWQYLNPGGVCVVDDLGSEYSDCVPNKHQWVHAQLRELYLTGQVEWYHWVNSLRGSLLIKKVRTK